MYICLPINIVYHNHFDTFHLTIVLVLYYLYALIRIRDHHFFKYAFFFLFTLSFFADWPAYFSGLILISFLINKRDVLEFKHLYLYTGIIMILSSILNFLIIVWLGGSFLQIFSALLSADIS